MTPLQQETKWGGAFYCPIIMSGKMLRLSWGINIKDDLPKILMIVFLKRMREI